MPGLTHSAARLAVVVALAGAPAHTTSRVTPPDTFDVYLVGVRIAELTVVDNGASRASTIRKKDVASNQWRSAVTAGESKAARDTAFFAAWGSPIKNLIPAMPLLRAIHWSSLRAVGWPDANTIYVPHTTQRENVNGHTISATRWVAGDAPNLVARRATNHPLDLIFADDDRLVAAIDVSNDIVLVRRGYERFTIVGRWNGPKASQPKYG